MKRTILLMSFICLAVLNVKGQEIANNTIGISTGHTISYQRKLSEIKRIEGNLTIRNTEFSNYTSFSTTYQRVKPLYELGTGYFNWYTALGGGVSFSKSKTRNYSGTSFFLIGKIGIEYNFKIPLLISLDVNPIPIFTDTIFGGGYIALGIRYQF